MLPDRETKDLSVRRNALTGVHGLRAGWRLLLYAALFCALGYVAAKVSGALSHGQQYDYGKPTVGIVYMLVISSVLLLTAGIMAKIEGRSLGEYGLPWRRM